MKLAEWWIRIRDAFTTKHVKITYRDAIRELLCEEKGRKKIRIYAPPIRRTNHQGGSTCHMT